MVLCSATPSLYFGKHTLFRIQPCTFARFTKRTKTKPQRRRMKENETWDGEFLGGELTRISGVEKGKRKKIPPRDHRLLLMRFCVPTAPPRRVLIKRTHTRPFKRDQNQTPGGEGKDRGRTFLGRRGMTHRFGFGKKIKNKNFHTVVTTRLLLRTGVLHPNRPSPFSSAF